MLRMGHETNKQSSVNTGTTSPCIPIDPFVRHFELCLDFCVELGFPCELLTKPVRYSSMLLIRKPGQAIIIGLYSYSLRTYFAIERMYSMFVSILLGCAGVGITCHFPLPVAWLSRLDFAVNYSLYTLRRHLQIGNLQQQTQSKWRTVRLRQK